MWQWCGGSGAEGPAAVHVRKKKEEGGLWATAGERASEGRLVAFQSEEGIGEGERGQRSALATAVSEVAARQSHGAAWRPRKRPGKRGSRSRRRMG